MPTKTFNSSSSEDWTVPAGVTSLTTVEATGPGADGGGPNVTLGSGGTNTDDLNHGGDGTLDGVGVAGLGPSTCIPGDLHPDPTNDYTVGTLDYDDDALSGASVEIWGGGGHGKFAGGGGGGYINMTMPVAPPCTKTVYADGATVFVVHHPDHGDLTFTAGRGADAVGASPGAGGVASYDSDPEGWVNVLQDGTPGTAATYPGGDGGHGGNWGQLTTVSVTAGKVIRVTRGPDYTEVRYDPTGANVKLLNSGNTADDVTSDLALTVLQIGGVAGAASSELGGGGGLAANSSGDGQLGSDGVTADEDDGADGVNPGDGGDGSGGHGASGGAGVLGFAMLTYSSSGVPRFGLSGSAPSFGVGGFGLSGSGPSLRGVG